LIILGFYIIGVRGWALAAGIILFCPYQITNVATYGDDSAMKVRYIVDMML